MPNPSFEIYDTCPYSSSQIYFAIPWKGVTTNSTDYYNACATVASGVSIPWGTSGSGGHFSSARTGNACAGLWAIDGYGSNYREYLQVKLDSTLEIDSCYFIQFYCNLVDICYYSINKMGAYLSNTAVGTVSSGSVLNFTPQIISHTFLTDTLHWMQVAGYYKSSGGEKYITIGNFDADIPADTLHMSGGTYSGAYYMIDDVTVKKISGCDTVGVGIQEYNNEISFNLYPNPATTSLTLALSKGEGIATIIITDVFGKEIKQSQTENKTTDIDISNLQNGIYLITVTDKKSLGKSVKKFVVLR